LLINLILHCATFVAKLRVSRLCCF
jgi:hypothetical protein